MTRHPLTLAAGTLLLASTLTAQQLQPPYDTVYSWTDLGSVPGVPTNYGGIVFKAGDPSKLLIGGNANGSGAAIYEVDVVRDASGFVTGFSGTATMVATAPRIDGGLFYGPGNVLCFTTYSDNRLGQIKPGSSSPDKWITLSSFGVLSSTGTGNFVPANFPGAGQLKVVSYNFSAVYGFTVTPDGNGTFDLTAANGPVTIQGGPEGYLYAPPGSALIPDYTTVIVSEYSAGTVALYDLDQAGNPIPNTRRPLLTGLSQTEGACTDPVTGDLFFSTFGAGNRVVRVTGFGVCGSFVNYGNGIPGTNGVPTITGSGCAGRGNLMAIDIQNGPAGASGLLAVGFTPNSIPFLNGQLLIDVTNSYFHILDGTGAWNLPLFLPLDPVFNGLNIYSQSFYLDNGGAFGVSATNGLHTLVR
ncbi:MAG: hypothetical protein NXI31_02225 [bacterium]|nr:hypothetical protein [bacterium]